MTRTGIDNREQEMIRGYPLKIPIIELVISALVMVTVTNFFVATSSEYTNYEIFEIAIHSFGLIIVLIALTCTLTYYEPTSFQSIAGELALGGLVGGSILSITLFYQGLILLVVSLVLTIIVASKTPFQSVESVIEEHSTFIQRFDECKDNFLKQHKRFNSTTAGFLIASMLYSVFGALVFLVLGEPLSFFVGLSFMFSVYVIRWSVLEYNCHWKQRYSELFGRHSDGD
jgi:hypothetical protein